MITDADAVKANRLLHRYCGERKCNDGCIFFVDEDINSAKTEPLNFIWCNLTGDKVKIKKGDD